MRIRGPTTTLLDMLYESFEETLDDSRFISRAYFDLYFCCWNLPEMIASIYWYVMSISFQLQNICLKSFEDVEKSGSSLEVWLPESGEIMHFLPWWTFFNYLGVTCIILYMCVSIPRNHGKPLFQCGALELGWPWQTDHPNPNLQEGVIWLAYNMQEIVRNMTEVPWVKNSLMLIFVFFFSDGGFLPVFHGGLPLKSVFFVVCGRWGVDSSCMFFFAGKVDQADYIITYVQCIVLVGEWKILEKKRQLIFY